MKNIKSNSRILKALLLAVLIENKSFSSVETDRFCMVIWLGMMFTLRFGDFKACKSLRECCAAAPFSIFPGR
jgi:hypothetical protein